MDCAICLSNPKEPVVVPCCNKVYCSKCITEWHQIKNSCPLCLTVSGDKMINNLKNDAPLDFDDGFIMLETQIKQIISRTDHLKNRIWNRKDQFKNKKSGISTSLIEYLDDQLDQMVQFSICIEENFLMLNRGATVEYMQLLTETIFQVQACLENNKIPFNAEYFDEYENDDYDYEDQILVDKKIQKFDDFEDYEVKNNKRHGNGKSKKGKAATFQGHSKVI